MENLTESINELKTSPKDQPRLGKCRLPLAVYEKNCLARIAELDRKMEIHHKSTLIWKKFRKQKLAQKARLQSRRRECTNNDEVFKIEKLT